MPSGTQLRRDSNPKRYPRPPERFNEPGIAPVTLDIVALKDAGDARVAVREQVFGGQRAAGAVVRRDIDSRAVIGIKAVDEDDGRAHLLQAAV